MSRIQKTVKNEYIYFLLIFLLMLAAERNVVSLGIGNDDGIFAEGIRTMGVIPWSVSFYNEWSGRVILTALDGILLNQNLIIWKVLNALVFANLVWQTAKLTGSNSLNRIVTLLAFFAVPVAILSSASLWITGSLNYLWPMSFGMVILRICRKLLENGKISGRLYLLAFISAIFAANCEQVGAVTAVMLAFSVLYHYFRYRKWDCRVVGLLMFVIANLLFLLLAPGNFIRAGSELLQWNPQFGMYNFFDKVNSGISLLMLYITDRGQYILLILSLLVLLKNHRKPMAYLPSLYFIFKLLTERLLMGNSSFAVIHYWLYEVSYFEMNSYLYPERWISIIAGLSVMLVLVYYLADSFSDESGNIFALLLFLAAMAATVIIGFSPTVIGSGFRIYFVTTVLLLVIIIMVLEQLDNRYLSLLVLVPLVYFAYENLSLFLMNSDFLYIYF